MSARPATRVKPANQVRKATTATMEDAASTRQRLVDAAERLFAERGYEGTSMRTLADVAGTNVAAANYHFGSKEGLLKAVVARAMTPVNAERERRLALLQAQAAGPSVEQLVRAFVEPGLELVDRHGERGPSVARFVGRVLFDPSPRIRQLFADQVDPVEGRYRDALRRALPDQDEAAVRFGYASMLALLAQQQAGTFGAITWRRDQPATGASDRERLVAFLTAGLTHGLPLPDSP